MTKYEKITAMLAVELGKPKKDQSQAKLKKLYAELDEVLGTEMPEENLPALRAWEKSRQE